METSTSKLFTRVGLPLAQKEYLDSLKPLPLMFNQAFLVLNTNLTENGLEP